MPREPEAGQRLEELLEQRDADDNHTEIIRAARALYGQGGYEPDRRRKACRKLLQMPQSWS